MGSISGEESSGSQDPNTADLPTEPGVPNGAHPGDEPGPSGDALEDVAPRTRGRADERA